MVFAMIDRDARNKLSALIRRYLDEDIMAFDLDEALDDFRDSSDSGLRFVTDSLWYHYDDCDDHLIVASKSEWDYFQRLLLLLESNSTVTTRRHRHWSATQIVAAVSLAMCGLIAFQTGVGSHLFIFFVPFGLCSIAISHFRHPAVDARPYDQIVTPFASIGDLRVAYDSASSFKKRQYQRRLESRLIRSPVLSAFWTAHMYVMWSILAPAPLLVQCGPITFNLPTVNPG